jgi:hydroxymethylglutaryl-CoA synthase
MTMPLWKTDRQVGVVGYGAYVPRYRLPATEVSRVWTGGHSGTPIREKAVAGPDEDTVTIAIEAARNALARTGGLDPARIGAVWVGSESHPYAVKPTGTILAEALGIAPYTLSGDWEFACKAGTEAVQAAIGLVGSGMTEFALAAGADTAQGRPGDALEYTTGSGGSAFILGSTTEGDAHAPLVIIEGSLSFVTDTPDFWRRAHQHYPQHGARFTGEPAYFKHTLSAASELMTSMGTRPADYAFAVFHQPNAKFPSRAGKKLGFSREQVAPGLLVNEIGNTYAGSSLTGLTAVLEVAQPGDRILLTSFGSGAGSDAFSLRVTPALLERRHLAPSIHTYVERRVEIDYAMYARFRKKLLIE